MAAGNIKALAPKLAGMRERLDALDLRAKDLLNAASKQLHVRASTVKSS